MLVNVVVKYIILIIFMKENFNSSNCPLKKIKKCYALTQFTILTDQKRNESGIL